MAATVALAPPRLRVQPGAEAIAQLTVTNTGRVVDAFNLEVLGPAGAWSRCDPPTLSLFPGQAGQARVIFAPPLTSSVPAGPLGFGVHVRSREDPRNSAVAEGVLDIAPAAQVTAEMSPRTARARGGRASKHVIAIDNSGNATVTVDLVGIDDQEQVDIEPELARVDVDAGAAVFVKVRTRAARPFWTGPSQTRPFIVEAQSPGQPPVRMPGTLLSEPRVPKWLPKALIAALAVLIALVIAWYGLFKPAVKNTATDAANSALSAAGVAVPSKGAGGGGGGGGGGGSSPSSTSSSSPTGPGAPVGPSSPVALQLTPTSSKLLDTKHQYSITDLVFQNPAGDMGKLVIQNGNTVLMTIALQDIRDYDLHFVTPILVTKGETFRMNIQCQNTNGAACTPTTLLVATVQAVA
jgi:hypothetical protein